MKVKITETLERIVEADSIEEVERDYADQNIVLDDSDFQGVTIKEVKNDNGD